MRRVGDRNTKELQHHDEQVKLSEHDIQNSIRIALSKLGYVVFRINVGKVKLKDGRWFDTGLPIGFSDLIAINNGQIYFLEVKDHKGKPSPQQLNFLEQMHKHGCKGGICRSVEDAIKILEED